MTDQYDCTVFGATGIPLESGRFRLTHGNFDPRNPDEYLVFDGSRILLKGDLRLEPLEPIRRLWDPPTPASAN